MQIIPAIDLIRGKCVRLTRGDYAQEKIYADNPVEQARLFYAKGARKLHLIDLEGAKLGKSAHLQVIKDLRQAKDLDGMSIEFGGGIRNCAAARTALQMGADLVIVGTAAYRDPAFLDELIKDMAENVAIAVDVRNQKVMVEGWLAEAGKGETGSIVDNLGKRGVKCIVFTDAGKDGTLAGVDVTDKSLAGVMARCEEHRIMLQYAGGVRDADDVRKLRVYEAAERTNRVARGQADMEILSGIVVGKALYEGTLDLVSALSAAAGGEA